MSMTLQELVLETLVEKHLRLQREKCKHREIFRSTYFGPPVAFRDDICLDCYKQWRTELAPAP